MTVTGHSDECRRSGTLDSAAGIRYRANKRGLAAPSPDFPALDFILAEMFLRKILDSTRKLPTSAGGIPPIYLSFFSAALTVTVPAARTETPIAAVKRILIAFLFILTFFLRHRFYLLFYSPVLLPDRA